MTAYQLQEVLMVKITYQSVASTRAERRNEAKI